MDMKPSSHRATYLSDVFLLYPAMTFSHELTWKYYSPVLVGHSDFNLYSGPLLCKRLQYRDVPFLLRVKLDAQRTMTA